MDIQTPDASRVDTELPMPPYAWQRGMLKKLPAGFARLFNYLAPHWKTIAGAVCFMLITAASSSVIALLLGKLTDNGFYEQNGAWLYWSPACLIGISLLHGCSTFGSSYLLQLVTQKVLLKLRLQMFDREMAWPYETYQKYTSGIVMSKYINEANAVLSGSAQILITIVRDSLQVVALLFVLIYYDWKLTLITLLISPVVAWIIRWVSKRTKKYVTLSQKGMGDMMSAVLESYDGQRIVKAYDGYARAHQRFEGVNAALYKLALKQQAVAAAGTPMIQFMTMSAVSIVVVVALVQSHNGLLTLGEFITFLSALLLLTNPIKKLAALNGSIARIEAAATSLFEVMDEPLEDEGGKIDLGRGMGAVRFENVAYRYGDSDKAAVENITLEVKPGETVAFVGASGAGKTTMINLIARFLKPTAGNIYFDSVKQSDISLKSLRAQIALVSQDVMLFDGTIGENIAYGRADAVREEVERAAEAACMMPFVSRMERGLDSPVGEGGKRLSGGQKQRVSIARALLKNAPILLLDEATSALDTESEKYIQSSLDVLMKGRTTFVVAHRLSTILGADKIVVMKDGEILEVGRHEELLAKNGAYAHLYNIQFAKKTPVASETAKEERA